MARRTKKQKIHAKQTNTLSWSPTTPSGSNSKSVKRELKKGNTQLSRNTLTEKRTNSSAKDESIGTIKRDIYKTLVITLFILGTELVLYWAL